MATTQLRSFASILLTVMAAAAGAAEVRTVDLDPPVLRDFGAALVMRPMADQRALYVSRTDRIRLHHRPVPLKPTTKPHATEMMTAPAELKLPGQSVLGKKVKVEIAKPSINQSAGIDVNYASPVSEPSVAARGNDVLVTGNWFAAFSVDGGKTFKSMDPFNIFGRFCCDQIAGYDAKTDTFFWLLQGTNDKKGNSFRLMLATGADFKNKKWWSIDLSSEKLLGQEGWWFDFPDLAFTEKNVYITTNIFATEGEGWGGSALIRLDKAALVAHQASPAKVVRDDVGSLRLTQGATNVMYWAGHNSRSDVLLGRWKDADASPGNPLLVDVETWDEPTKATIDPSNGPDGRGWLGRLDGRITASWIANKTIGFAWAVGSDARFKMPHVRVAKVKESAVSGADPAAKKISASGQPHIWSEKMAFAYPAAAPNSKSEVGIALAYGGPSDYPSFAVGIMMDNDKDPPLLTSAIKGAAPPSCLTSAGTKKDCSVWGDYFSVRPHGKMPGRWVVVGFTVQSKYDDADFIAPAEYIQFYRAP